MGKERWERYLCKRPTIDRLYRQTARKWRHLAGFKLIFDVGESNYFKLRKI